MRGCGMRGMGCGVGLMGPSVGGFTVGLLWVAICNVGFFWKVVNTYPVGGSRVKRENYRVTERYWGAICVCIDHNWL